MVTIPFETFAGFEWLEKGGPILACEPPEWAAAAHAMVVGNTVHYLWARRRQDNYWMLMYSTAPVSDPSATNTTQGILFCCLRRKVLTISLLNTLSHFGILLTVGFMSIILVGEKDLPSRQAYWLVTEISVNGHVFVKPLWLLQTPNTSVMAHPILPLLLWMIPYTYLYTRPR